MQSTNLPSKYLVPFAKNDGSKVELPVTTATSGRASQSLGFPPITGQPPEAGGLPPQLEDFNGAMNQPARIAWWSQLGGKFPFDNTFATDSNINGYPLGAELVASDNAGTWLSLADNNVANPDTTGTGWAPARAYGAFALSGQTGGTVTPTPLQAMKRRIAIAGALTSNLVVILPNWLYSWDVTNNTSGAFTVTVKTSAGAGVVVPQNGSPTPLQGDGTNIYAPANNVPVATTSTQAMQLGQAIGRLLNIQTFNASGTYTPTAGTTSIVVEVLGGGGGGAGAGVVANAATTISYGGGGGGGGYAKGRLSAGSATIVVGAGGSASSSTGNNGNPSSFTSTGGTLTAGGGAGGGVPAAASAFPVLLNSGAGGTGAGGNIYSSGGGQGAPCIINSTASAQGGGGGLSQFGAGARQVGINVDGLPSPSPGGGGSGGCANSTTVARAGGAGGAGVVVVWEYA